jgi:hypothetical protein
MAADTIQHHYRVGDPANRAADAGMNPTSEP